MTTVTLPRVASPSVTVVMTTYGRWDLCRRALAALVENTEPTYHVVVVDNASDDGTADRLRHEVDGATLVFNTTNVGFGAASNQGALRAAGRHLCFLNSDAFVRPGWLPPLLEVLDGDPAVAAVVPRYLNPDGTLQEAASLVGGDAATTSLGYGDDPDRPEYRFRRTVDYASAACLVVRRRDFEAAGGFDPRYPMAYYEDVDLCFTFAARGLRTVYEPRSQVDHVRGGSGTMESAVRLITSNRAVFAERWAEALVWRPALAEVDRHPHRAVALRDAPCPDRVLVLGEVDPVLPAELARSWPHMRVTVVSRAGIDQALLDAGVEVVDGRLDIDDWLEARRLHYSVVVLGGLPALARFRRPLARFQPEALRLLVGTDGDPPAPDDVHGVLDASHFGEGRFRATLVDAMSQLGVAPPLTRLERRMAGR
jgi:GT2 family glycosyltransferase